MYELKKIWKNYLRVNLLGPGPRLIKKKSLPGRGLTKVEKHCSTGSLGAGRVLQSVFMRNAQLCGVTFNCFFLLQVSITGACNSGRMGAPL